MSLAPPLLSPAAALPDGLVDLPLLALGLALIALLASFWVRRWPIHRPGKAVYLGHALLVTGFFVVPLATSLAQVPVDLAYQWRPWKETRTEPVDIQNELLSDIPLQMLPFRTLVRRSLLAGEVPLWAHELATGQPLLGNAQSAPFAPLHALTLPVPTLRGLTLAAAWQVYLGLLLTHLLVLVLAGPRGPPGSEADPEMGDGPSPRLVQLGAALAAVSFAFSSYSIVWLYHPLSGVAQYIPGVLAAVFALHRGWPRAGAGLVVLSAALAVSGHPETLVHTAAVAGLVALVLLAAGPVRRGEGGEGPGRLAFLGRLVLAGGLAFCLAAPALLPFAEAVGQSERMAAVERSHRAVAPSPFEPVNALPTVQPLVFGSPRSETWDGPMNYNEMCSQYGGALALALALAGVLVLPGRRRLRLLAILVPGLLALLAGLGVEPFHGALTAIPVLGYAAHGRLRLFWALAVALAAGLALPHLVRSRGGRRWGAAAVLVAVLVVVALVPPLAQVDLAEVGLTRPDATGPAGLFHHRAWWWVVMAGLGSTALGFAVQGFAAQGLPGRGLALGGRLGRWRPGAAVAALALAATAADLVLLALPYHPLVDPSMHLEAPPALAWIEERMEESLEAPDGPEPFRVLAEGWDMLPNLVAVGGLWDPRGNDPMRPWDPAWLVGKRLSDGRWKRSEHILLQGPWDDGFQTMLGVRYVLAPHRRIPPEPWRVVHEHQGGKVLEHPSPLPLFFVPEAVRTVPDLPSARYLAVRIGDFRAQAVALPSEAASFPEGGPPIHRRPQEGEVRITGIDPNGFELAAEVIEPPAGEPGLLVASSVSWAPGWRAFLDGEPAPGAIEPVNWTFLGVRVPPGTHRVRLEYRPAGWVWGLWLFWGALAGLLVAGLVRHSRWRSSVRP